MFSTIPDLIRLIRTGLARSLRKRGVLAPLSAANTVVLSYPKSGRTWLRAMLDDLGVPAHYDHADANTLYHPTEAFTLGRVDKEKYRDARVVVLRRDPRDVLVSSYFEATRRQDRFRGPLSAFIRDERFGIEKLLRFQSHWTCDREFPAPCLPVCYEDMVADTLATMVRILDFLRVRKVSARGVRDAVAHSSFDKMQRLERDGFLRILYGRKLKAATKGDYSSQKVRRGKVGGYRDYLTEEDIAFCTQLMRAAGSPYA